MESKTVINCQIDKETREKFKAHLASRGATISAWMQNAIYQYMAENKIDHTTNAQ